MMLELRGKMARGRSEEAAVGQPRSEASEETDLPIPRSWTCGLQNRENSNFCCRSHSVCGVLLRPLEN